MAIDWDLYEKRLNINGSTKRERDLYGIKQILTDKLPESPSCKSVTINGVARSLALVKSTNDIIEIHSLPNETLNVGDTIIYKTNTFLVKESNVDDEVYTSAKMQLTNWLLKWQSPTGAVLSTPCITSSTRLGQEEGKVITLPNNQKSVLLRANENTILFTNGDRFYIDHNYEQVYKIVGTDNVTRNGLIEMIVEQDLELNSTEHPDRPDLGVCNYVEPIIPDEPVEGYSYATIACSNPNNELILGSNSYISLSPTFFEADDTLASGITAVWTWTYPVGFDSSFTVNYVGNVAKIKVTENYDLIGQTVTGSVIDGSSGYIGSIVLIITM